MAAKKIRVVVVDDSPLIRTVLVKELNKQPDIEVVAAAADPVEAKKLILQHKPDVLTLDIEMPQMDGLTFLGILQRYHPMPVVMLSSLTASGSNLAMEALRRGATEVMQKPGGGSFLALGRVIDQLAFKIRASAVAKHRKLPSHPGRQLLALNTDGSVDNATLIAIGASTGGTEALRYVFSRLPENLPPIVVVQHMPEAFTASFAEGLNRCSQITVVEGKETVDLQPGLAVVAQGGKHLVIAKRLASYRAMPKIGEPVCHQCPSVDVLFDSAAQAAGPDAVGVILTGMGEDGADGLLAMRQAGATTIAQDESSCVVFGMPKEAIARGAAQHVLALERIPQGIVNAVRVKAAARV